MNNKLPYNTKRKIRELNRLTHVNTTKLRVYLLLYHTLRKLYVTHSRGRYVTYGGQRMC
jgi:hypothetical protein